MEKENTYEECGFLKAMYFSIVNLLAVKVCAKFFMFIVTEDMFMNVTACSVSFFSLVNRS